MNVTTNGNRSADSLNIRLFAKNLFCLQAKSIIGGVRKTLEGASIKRNKRRTQPLQHCKQMIGLS
jgi:hypothetical protein